MNSIAHALAELEIGAPQICRNLAVFPLLAREELEPGYITLDEALEAGAAHVSEISEGGSVPELRFANDSTGRILLVDGEELVGARQNRILNLSILVGAGQTVVIPVSCVERGRWSYRGRHFGSAKRSLFGKARAAKMRDVSRHMSATGSRAGDQMRVWADIDCKQEALRVESPTCAMNDVYTARAADVGEYESAFQALPRQVGAVFVVNGTVRGADVFDSAVTFRKVARKLVGSYALDAVEERGQPNAGDATLDRVRAFLAELQRAPEQRYKSLAEGDDVRLESPAVAAGALEFERKMVHLAAFATEA